MSDTPYTSPTHGNISTPGKQGFYGLPMGVLAIAGFFLLLTLICVITTQYPLAAICAALAVTAAVVTLRKDKNGYSVYQKAIIMLMFRARERRGDTLNIAGPAGRTPDGKTRLPGLLASSELTEHLDTYGNRFGLIRLHGVKHYTVVIETFPDGDTLVDADRVDTMVAHWGAWLAELGTEGSVIGASVTVETAAETGQRLERMVHSNLADTASTFAEQVATALPDEIRADTPRVSAYIAVTFSGRGFDKDGSDQGLDAMAAEIGARLPVMLGNLHETGAGTAVRACTAQDIIDYARTAYDPVVGPAIEQARADGGTGLTWTDAGPKFHKEYIDRYCHDRAVSKTWEMYVPPTGVFRSSSLGGLLQPVGGVLRKRVTLLYRPVVDSDAMDVLESEFNNAELVASQKHRASPQQVQRMRAAAQSQDEVQRGAGLLRFGLLVTATTESSAEFARLDKVIPGLTSRAGRLRLRESLGNQAVAFQSALPLGVVPIEHAALGKFMQEWI